MLWRTLTPLWILNLPGCCGFGSCGSGCDWSDPYDCTEYDEDVDGYTACSDCDDHDGSVHPGAQEICDGEDDDCDLHVDNDAEDEREFYLDDDGDGYGDGHRESECSAPAGYVAIDGDCDDTEPAAYPEHTEICDGIDNDCDDAIDEDVADAPTWYLDSDGDGVGDPATATIVCDAPEGYVADGTDCNDADASAFPGATELCATGVDEDCEAATPDECSHVLASLDEAALGGGYGHHSDENAGGALANAGDVNGDGYDDVLIGAAGSGAVPAGAYLVLAPVNGMVSLSGADAHLETDDSTDSAGSAVAGAGDVDGDGYADVLMGAPAAQVDGASVGAAWLFYGPDLSDCAPFCDGAVYYGAADGDAAGSALAGVGDVDGDGLDDLLVGLPGRGGGGGAALLTDAPAGVLGEADAAAILEGEGAGRAGTFVLAAGDVDDDGYDDLAVADPAGSVVWLVTSQPTGSLQLADSAVRAEVDVGDGTLSGVVIDDLDGDGFLDLLVSATTTSSQATEVLAWGSLGPLAGALSPGDDLAVHSGGIYANAGATVVSLGDLDFDGSAELAFSAGSATALLPPDFTESLSHGTALWIRPGPLASTDAWLTDSALMFPLDAPVAPVVAAGGDVNRDARADLLVGDPLDDSDDTDSGAWWALSGAGLY